MLGAWYSISRVLPPCEYNGYIVSEEFIGTIIVTIKLFIKLSYICNWYKALVYICNDEFWSFLSNKNIVYNVKPQHRNNVQTFM